MTKRELHRRLMDVSECRCDETLKGKGERFTRPCSLLSDKGRDLYMSDERQKLKTEVKDLHSSSTLGSGRGNRTSSG